MTREEEIKQVSEEVLGTVEYQCGFADGARWADKTMIDKACNWFTDHFEAYSVLFTTEQFIEDFKKAMEE